MAEKHGEEESAAGPPSLDARLARPATLLLDGATGTQLESRGVASGLPLWSSHALIDAPEAVESIHRDYARAGAEILTANTFRTQKRVLGRAPETLRRLSETREGAARSLTRRAVDLARAATRAAAHPVWVAGSAPTLEDCYRPDLVPEQDVLRHEHDEHARNLAHAGVDLILIETMNSIREAVAASRAAAATGLPFIVSFVSWRDARLLSGELLADAIDGVRDAGPALVGVNCLPPSAVASCLPALRSCGLGFGVYANLGAPAPETTGDGERSESCSPADFAQHATDWIGAGARLVGGCCGTTPAHIAAIAQRLHA